MKLGVTFDNLYHTVNDWKLHFAALQINEPDVQTYQLSVPGRDGVLDLTDALYGKTTYLNRTITMNFWTELSRSMNRMFKPISFLFQVVMVFSILRMLFTVRQLTLTEQSP